MLAVLAGCLSACATQEVEAPLPVKEQGTRVHFTAGSLQTKTAFAEPTVEDGVATYPTRWTANDTEVAISLNYETAIAAGGPMEMTRTLPPTASRSVSAASSAYRS